MVRISPSDVELGPRTLVQPDLYVLPLVEGRRPRGRPQRTRPILVIEVLWPSTARYDRLKKRRYYTQAGIEYWMVDLDARLLERTLGGDDRVEVIDGRVEWQGPGASGPLVIDLDEMFREALDE